MTPVAATASTGVGYDPLRDKSYRDTGLADLALIEGRG